MSGDMKSYDVLVPDEENIYQYTVMAHNKKDALTKLYKKLEFIHHNSVIEDKFLKAGMDSNNYMTEGDLWPGSNVVMLCRVPNNENLQEIQITEDRLN